MNEGPLPMGLGMMVAQNAAASQRRERLTEAEKEKLICRIRGAETEAERRRLTAELENRSGLGEARIPAEVFPVFDLDAGTDHN